MTRAEIKALLVEAHRTGDWERAAALSQEKQAAKRKERSQCVVCGVTVHRGAAFCGMHFRQGRKRLMECVRLLESGLTETETAERMGVAWITVNSYKNVFRREAEQAKQRGLVKV